VQLAIEFALHDPVYQNVAAKFYEHFLWIAGAMNGRGRPEDLWDETDGFFDDLLRGPSTEARACSRPIRTGATSSSSTSTSTATTARGAARVTRQDGPGSWRP
jgi:hypothetical protein